ncbi:MAG: ABC transporter ATP-binding protein [Bacteroidales bacterium]
MIEVKNLCKSFGDHRVLKNVSCTFLKGKTNLIIGQSGSGKTVLMKSCVGLHTPDSGAILFNNRDFFAMKEKQKREIRKEVGMLFQGGALFDSLNVEQNVMFPLNMFTNMTLGEKLKRVNLCLDRVNLPKVNHLMPSELSGGMIKRVAIARAISMEPSYLFCDEPNSGLDPHTASVIDNLISEITHELDITTVVNTHDMNSVLEIGENISFIYKGELWWQGNKDTILHTDNNELNEFVFTNELTRRLKS